MDAQPFPRPLKFLEENDALLAHFYALVGRTGPLASAWLLAVNQVAAAYPGFAPHLPIGSPHPTTQRGVVFLGSSLNALKVKPLDYLIEQLQKHAPDLVRVCGRYLLYDLESTILRDVRQNLGFPPEPRFRWRGEFLTADNPIWIGPHLSEPTIIAGRTIPAGTMTVTPPEATVKHAIQVSQYINTDRPTKPPGRPRKPPSAPPRRRPQPPDPLAVRAAALKQQGLRWRAIVEKLRAEKLWPDEPLPTEHNALERVRKHVGRLVNKGLLDTVR